MKDETLMMIIPCATAISISLLLFGAVFCMSSCQVECTKVNAENGLLTLPASGSGYVQAVEK